MYPPVVLPTRVLPRPGEVIHFRPHLCTPHREDSHVCNPRMQEQILETVGGPLGGRRQDFRLLARLAALVRTSP